MRNLLIISLFILCLGACTPGHNSYSDFCNISESGWEYNDTVSFTPTIDDSIANGKLSIALRHNNSYHYSNLWLEVGYNINDSTIKNDTLNIELADIYGKWHGSGIGTSYQLEQNVTENITIKNGAPIKVRHIMRVDTLGGIEQIGIFFHPRK